MRYKRYGTDPLPPPGMVSTRLLCLTFSIALNKIQKYFILSIACVARGMVPTPLPPPGMVSTRLLCLTLNIALNKIEKATHCPRTPTYMSYSSSVTLKGKERKDVPSVTTTY